MMTVFLNRWVATHLWVAEPTWVPKHEYNFGSYNVKTLYEGHQLPNVKKHWKTVSLWYYELRRSYKMFFIIKIILYNCEQVYSKKYQMESIFQDIFVFYECEFLITYTVIIINEIYHKQ